MAESLPIADSSRKKQNNDKLYNDFQQTSRRIQ